jgi:hypothetical protein
VLVLPETLAVDATSPAGATVTYTASATDDQDPAPVVVCAPASGSLFAIGDTEVGCVATDAAGHSQAGSFAVHVKSADEQLADLELAVSGVGPGRSLASKVRAARSSLSLGNAAAGVQSLRAFVQEVEAQSGKTIPADLATTLVASAERVAAVLGLAL